MLCLDGNDGKGGQGTGELQGTLRGRKQPQVVPEDVVPAEDRACATTYHAEVEVKRSVVCMALTKQGAGSCAGPFGNL